VRLCATDQDIKSDLLLSFIPATRCCNAGPVDINGRLTLPHGLTFRNTSTRVAGKPFESTNGRIISARPKMGAAKRTMVGGSEVLRSQITPKAIGTLIRDSKVDTISSRVSEASRLSDRNRPSATSAQGEAAARKQFEILFNGPGTPVPQ
jgi:hypothetical protein